MRSGELRDRLRWRRDEVVATLATNDPAVVARAFAYLFGLGGLLVAAAPALPGSQLRHVVPVWVAVGCAVLVSAGVLAGYDRTPDRVLRTLPAVGTVLVTMVLLGARDAAVGPFALLYFWVVLSAFYFFGRESGLLHLGFVVGCFAVVLVGTHVPQPAMWALLTVSTLSVTGLMLALLRARADTLIVSLDAAARTDPLTGLLNRRAFDEELRLQLARATRSGRPLSLLSLDVDDFKSINDRFGHQAGDEVLQQVAAALGVSRESDSVGRVGGDEFGVLLPDTSPQAAVELAGRVFDALAGGSAELPVPARASIGLACSPSDAQSERELREAADCALYVAKHAGGDRIVAYEPGMREVLAMQATPTL